MRHTKTIVVMIITIVLAYVIIVTFHINIFQLSVIQFFSLMITLASSAIVIFLSAHLFGFSNKPVLEFEGIFKTSHALSKTEYYIRVGMVEHEGNVEKCSGYYSIGDIRQTPSIWRDGSKNLVISKQAPGNLLLFSIANDEKSHNWIVFPKIREESSNLETKKITIDEIIKPYEEYKYKVLNVVVSCSSSLSSSTNIKDPIRWSKNLSEFIQMATPID
jgi:hypothetical protein